LQKAFWYCDTDVHRHIHRFKQYTDPHLQQQLAKVMVNPEQDPNQRIIIRGFEEEAPWLLLAPAGCIC
jgi:hypothetical protein